MGVNRLFDYGLEVHQPSAQSACCWMFWLRLRVVVDVEDVVLGDGFDAEVV
jgi:hypothetical protein